MRYFACKRHGAKIHTPKGQIVFSAGRYATNDPRAIAVLDRYAKTKADYWETTEEGVPLDPETRAIAPKNWDHYVEIEMADGTKLWPTKGEIATILASLQEDKAAAEEPEEELLADGELDLKDLRQEMGVSQTEMAKLLGVSLTTYRKAEKDPENMPESVIKGLDSLEALSAA